MRTSDLHVHKKEKPQNGFFFVLLSAGITKGYKVSAKLKMSGARHEILHVRSK